MPSQKKDNAKKVVSVALDSEGINDLSELVAFFQEQSPSTITKSDVIKYLLSKTNEAVKNENELTDGFLKALQINRDYKIGKIT